MSLALTCSNPTRGSIPTIPVLKRKRKGRVDWFFQFSASGSTREQRRLIRGYGYRTKEEAANAEAARRLHENVAAGVAAPVPATLDALLQECMAQHVKKLSSTTIENYSLWARYLDPKLKAMPIREITSLHLHREWDRLVQAGGIRKGKEGRLSPRSVQNICGWYRGL